MEAFQAVIFVCLTFASFGAALKVQMKLKAGLIAVGMDNYLYTKRALSPLYSWLRVPDSCCVTQIHALKSGAVVGVGTNRHLYVKKSLLAPWQGIPNSCCVTDITTVKRNGKEVFLGIGTNRKLYIKTELNAKWKPTRKILSAVSIAGAGRKIISVSKSHRISVRHGLNGKPCRLPKPYFVSDIFFKGGSIYGVTLKHGIVQRKVPDLATPKKGWCKKLRRSTTKKWRKVKDSCCVQSISLPKRPISFDVIMVGVGMDHQLYFKSSLFSQWGRISKSGDVNSIAFLNDGSLIGVGTNNQLYTRKSVDQSEWSLVPGSCCVKSVTQLPNGKIIGVGMGNTLLQKHGLTRRWSTVPHSCCVTSVTALKDGSIVGAGMDGALYQRQTINSPWTGPIGNSLDVKIIDVKYSTKNDLLYGVTNANKVVQKECNSIDSQWEYVSRNSCCVSSIALR